MSTGSRPARGGSFTARVVAELAPHIPPRTCCRGALLDGMSLTGPDPAGALLLTTRLVAARAALQSLHAASLTAHVAKVVAPRGSRYRVTCEGSVPEPSSRACCARIRLRGAFLATGTVSRPDTAAHLEIPVRDRAAAGRLLADLARLDVPATAVRRRGRSVVTLRSTSAVGDGLTVMGAQAARLAFEEARVRGEMRSEVNRRINAETANLRRGVAAAIRQVAAISDLRCADRWAALAPALREAADLRERHPDDNLQALARRAGCSRPAMAGRLHRLVAAADSL